MVHFAGAEFKLRPGMTLNFGYIAFLAAWLARHDPVKVAGAALLLALIAIGGDSLQVDSGLPAAAVNVLMGLVLVAVQTTLVRPTVARLGESATLRAALVVNVRLETAPVKSVAEPTAVMVRVPAL